MPRSLFSRVFLQSVLVLLALLAAGGFALDRFLSESEIGRLGDQAERFARMLKEDAVRAPGQPELQSLVRRMGEATRVRFTVMDGTGRVLADSLLDPARMENHATHPEMAEALAGREGRNLRRSQSLGIDMLYVAVPGEPVVRAALSVSEVRAVLDEVRLRILFAAFPAVFIALLLAFVLARSLTVRIGRMIRFASEIEKGKFDGEFRVLGNDELSDMERSLLALRGEIRRQLDRLRRDREFLNGLIEGLPHPVLVFDGKKNLSLANAPARALLRFSAAEAGLPAGEVVRHPRVLEALDALGRGEGAPEPFRLTWTDPHAHLEVIVHPLPGEDGARQFLAVLRDVTREVHLERVRSDFMANLSHELRTPLTAIRGSAETLLDAAPADSAVSGKFLETIRRNALRLEALLSDVSDLARAETGAETPEMQLFDAREPLRHTADLFAGEAQKAGVRLEARMPGEAVELFSDVGMIERILVNLVQNGVRYTPAGGTVLVSLAAGDGAVVYEVADTGIGIPPADLPRVTERFYRVDPGRSRAMGGTGLGLAIVKHLTEALGGVLEIQSELGKGTTVTIRLPSVAAK